MTITRHIFIGYDEREESAYQVARYSILSQVNPEKPVAVYKLDHRTLRNMGLFTREWLIESNGQYVDKEDKKPFSTQFSHSRFLIPALAKELGLTGKALFVDCDFVFKGDVNDLFDELDADTERLLWCVKHDFTPKSEIKMDNMIQAKYKFKLWTAAMVFNLDNPALYEMLPKERVNSWAGRALHTFQWLNTSHTVVDQEIGNISEAWQFIPDHSEERVRYKDIRAIHYTEGGPWFEHMKDCKYAKDWLDEYQKYVEYELFAGVCQDAEKARNDAY